MDTGEIDTSGSDPYGDRLCPVPLVLTYWIWSFTPIRGLEGNIEYLVHLKKCGKTGHISEKADVEKTVEEAFATLSKA